jgi:hypothetical protein
MKIYLLLVLLNCAIVGHTQLCLGNSTQETAVQFDPNWVYGCATGTSCSGGTQFNNLPDCEPSTPMDICAPAPTCVGGTNGSDLWYFFYASNTTATLSVIQNTSYVAAIQAFSGGADCTLLSEIGCAIAGGPSSGVQLVLTGLNIGELYYFRVYGSANNNSQRTGNYCFCGTTGISGVPLIPAMSLDAESEGESALLRWTVAAAANIDHYVLERGTDSYTFATVAAIDAEWQSEIQDYQFVDRFLHDNRNFYRIKAVNANGTGTYSNIVEVQIAHQSTFLIAGNPTLDMLHVHAREPFVGKILNLHGATIFQQAICVGENQLDVATLPSGTYFFKNAQNGAFCRFFIQR